MLLSWDWLLEHLGRPALDVEAVALQLTMATAETEGVHKIERCVDGLFVGRITDVQAIAGQENNRLVRVAVGDKEYETVCGAPNARVGLVSVFAPVGAKLAGGLQVAERKVGGAISQGVLCSCKELDWGEHHVGIVELPESIAAGTPVAEIVPATDYTIEIDNKSITHRPDLWGHYGFAREIAAILKIDLTPLGTVDLEQFASLPAFPMEVEPDCACPGYTCLAIDNCLPVASPMPVQLRLLSVGVRPINLLVDLTNYIMYELGQPMHAFDAKQIDRIRVAPFGEAGTFTTLDDVERKMRPDDLMIWDGSKPVAVAGVMGGQNSEVSETTTGLVLESANFEALSIRRTSLRIGVRTDASQRFEKNQPLVNMEVSVGRFLQLLDEAGQDYKVTSSLATYTAREIGGRTITIPAAKFPRAIGHAIEQETVSDILNRLGFAHQQQGDDLVVEIPAYRGERDMAIPEDLVEEVARVYGYDNVDPQMPQVDMRPRPINKQRQCERRARNYLSAARGYSEVHTYSWFDDRFLKAIKFDPGATLVLENPSAEYNSRMRTTLMPNLLATLEASSLQFERFALYELGRAYEPEGESGCRERALLTGISYAHKRIMSLQDLLLTLKNDVLGLGEVLDIASVDFRTHEELPQGRPWLQAGLALPVVAGEEHVGYIGVLPPEMTGKFRKGGQAAWMELEFAKLVEQAGGRERVFEQPPTFPGSWMDFSILWEHAQGFEKLQTVLGGFSHPLLKKTRFLYAFAPKDIDKKLKSYTFRYWLGHDERTLENEDITGFREAYLAHLAEHDLSIRQ